MTQKYRESITAGNFSGQWTQVECFTSYLFNLQYAHTVRLHVATD